MRSKSNSASSLAACLFGILTCSSGASDIELARINAPSVDGLHRFSSEFAAGTNFALASARMPDLTEVVYIIDLKMNAVVGQLDIPNALPRDEISQIAMEGDVAVIAVLNRYSRDRAGGVYLADLQSSTIRELRVPSLSSEPFLPTSVAIDEQYIVVGSSEERFQGVWRNGAVRIFDRHTGDYLRTLIPDHLTQNGTFGMSVGVSDGQVIVGAPNYRSDGVPGLGAAFLFDACTGSLVAQLQAPGYVVYEQFGMSVAIGSGVVAVGEPNYSESTIWHGRVCAFDSETGNLLYQRVSFAPAFLQYFGMDLSISEGRLHVGATGDQRGGSNRSGAVFSYDVRTGAPVGEFLPSDSGGWLGLNVVQRDGVLYSSAPYSHDPDDAPSGSVYMFDGTIPACFADVNGNGVVNQSDLSSFLFALQFGLREADLAEPYGTINFWDIVRFTDSWSAGCYE